MKSPRPGQFCTINGVVYRAKKRTDYSCYGCALRDLMRCPNIVDSRNGQREIDCNGMNIILVRV